MLMTAVRLRVLFSGQHRRRKIGSSVAAHRATDDQGLGRRRHCDPAPPMTSQETTAREHQFR